MLGYSGSADKECDPKAVTQLDCTSIYAQLICVICLQNIEALPTILLRGKSKEEP